jgi:hypothetical protein
VSLLTMYDSIDLTQFPASVDFAAGYVNGKWPTARELAARYPHAQILTIAVTSGADAGALDIETGDATPADAPGWHKRQRARGAARPCLYANASTMQAGIVPLVQSGAIPRAAVRLWSAHYTEVAHICGPRSCRAVSIDMDGTQWTDRAAGRNLDQSLLLPGFFGAAAAPPPRPVPPAAPPTVAQPREWTTAGQLSLAALAREHGTVPSALLRATAEKSPGGLYPAEVAAYLNGVFAGQIDPRKPMPKGLKLWLPG